MPGNVIKGQLSEKLKKQGDGSWKLNNVWEISQLRNANPKFRKIVCRNPSNPEKRYKKRSAEFPQQGENSTFISSEWWIPKLWNPSWDESLEVTDIPVGLAKRYPIRQGRNVVVVEASGLPPQRTGNQDPKSGYHYDDRASTEAPLMTNRLESRAVWSLTPIHSSPLVGSSNFSLSNLIESVLPLLRHSNSSKHHWLLRTAKVDQQQRIVA